MTQLPGNSGSWIFTNPTVESECKTNKTMVKHMPNDSRPQKLPLVAGHLVAIFLPPGPKNSTTLHLEKIRYPPVLYRISKICICMSYWKKWISVAMLDWTPSVFNNSILVVSPFWGGKMRLDFTMGWYPKKNIRNPQLPIGPLKSGAFWSIKLQRTSMRKSQ